MMSKKDIEIFLASKGITITDQELDFIYNYIIKHVEEVLDNPNAFDFDKLKDKFSEDTFKKLKEIVEFYKQKYLNNKEFKF